MKPLRVRIREAARASGVSEQVVEKDYALSYILAGLAVQPELRGTLVFKGGTALKKLYFGDYRFSEDLDFSAAGAPRSERLEAAIRLATVQAADLLREHGAFHLETVRYLERDPHPLGQEAFLVRLRFPWHPAPLCRIKLEVSHDEPVILEPDLRPLIHGYEEELAISILCYHLEELIAEKMRCLLQTHERLLARGWNRPRARDYYELWRLLRTFGSEIDKDRFPALLDRKCSLRDVSYSSVEDFFTAALITEAETHWQSNLRPFVKDLPDCDSVLSELRTLMCALLSAPGGNDH